MSFEIVRCLRRKSWNSGENERGRRVEEVGSRRIKEIIKMEGGRGGVDT